MGWLGALLLVIVTYAHAARRWRQLGVLAAIAVAGPAVAAGVTAALRTWLPRGGGILSLAGVLRELAHSPVFYLSLAFAVSWSLLGLWARPPGARALRDRWAYLPLLVWALLVNRHHFFYFETGLHDFPLAVRVEILWVATWVVAASLLSTLAAMLPTLIQDRARRHGLVLDLPALLPVAVVLVDWAFFASILTTFWLRQASQALSGL